jgi:hypothetical protein
LIWVLTATDLRQVESDPRARRVLARGQIYEIVGETIPKAATGDLAAVPTADFKSVADLEQALKTNRLDPAIRAVVYDNESWSFTPLDEQRHPDAAMARAARLVRSSGRTFISAPGTDLAGRLNKKAASPLAAYLAEGLAGAAATSGGILDIQAQVAERDPAQFRRFVTAAAAQARAANPTIRIVVGLTTESSLGPVSGDDLANLMAPLVGQVDGFWISDPTSGPFCPNCGPSRPDVVRAALGLLQGLP